MKQGRGSVEPFPFAFAGRMRERAVVVWGAGPRGVDLALELKEGPDSPVSVYFSARLSVEAARRLARELLAAADGAPHGVA